MEWYSYLKEKNIFKKTKILKNRNYVKILGFMGDWKTLEISSCGPSVKDGIQTNWNVFNLHNLHM